MDTTWYAVNEALMNKAKNARLFAMVAMILSGIYLIEGILSIVLQLIPIPFLGLIFFFMSLVIEFVLVVAIIVFTIMALVNIVSVEKSLKTVLDSDEKEKVKSINNLAKIFVIVAIVVTFLVFIPISLLNIVELFLSIF